MALKPLIEHCKMCNNPTEKDELDFFSGYCVKCQKFLCCKCKSEDAKKRFSLGLYAGTYCDKCWAVSGYRKEGKEGFDPADAGESYDPID